MKEIMLRVELNIGQVQDLTALISQKHNELIILYARAHTDHERDDIVDLMKKLDEIHRQIAKASSK